MKAAVVGSGAVGCYYGGRADVCTEVVRKQSAMLVPMITFLERHGARAVIRGPDQSELGVGSVAIGTFGCPPNLCRALEGCFPGGRECWGGRSRREAEGVSRSAVSPSIRHFELGATTLAAPCSALPWRAAGPPPFSQCRSFRLRHKADAAPTQVNVRSWR
jgi:hypothetical protein